MNKYKSIIINILYLQNGIENPVNPKKNNCTNGTFDIYSTKRMGQLFFFWSNTVGLIVKIDRIDKYILICFMNHYVYNDVNVLFCTLLV